VSKTAVICVRFFGNVLRAKHYLNWPMVHVAIQKIAVACFLRHGVHCSSLWQNFVTRVKVFFSKKDVKEECPKKSLFTAI